MTNSEIRNAAALDLAADEAARTWVIAEDSEWCFPEQAKQLLQRVDVMRGSVRMAPIVSVDGQPVPNMARSFECFPDDVRPAQW